jgi:hypothetical protein
MNEAFVWGLHDPRLLRIKYEDLCCRPVETLTEVTDFLGVGFDESQQQQTLRHLGESAKPWDASGPGSGLPPDRMPEIWRNRLTETEIRSILGVAGQLRQQLGYPSP